MNNVVTKKYFIGRSVKKGEWSSVYMYKPQNDVLKDRLGQVFATIALSAPPDFNVSTAGNLILDFFHETYFETKEDNVLLALEKAVLATSKQLQKLMKNDKSIEYGIEMTLTVMAVVKDNVYIVNMGEGSVFVFRNGDLSHLSRYLKDPRGDKMIEVGSFQAERADVMILATPAAHDEITLDEFIDSAVEFSEIKFKNKAFDDESKVSLVLVGFNVDRKESREELVIHNKVKEEVEEAIENLGEQTQEGHTTTKNLDFIEERIGSDETDNDQKRADVFEDELFIDEDEVDSPKGIEIINKIKSQVSQLFGRFSQKDVKVKRVQSTPHLDMDIPQEEINIEQDDFSDIEMPRRTAFGNGIEGDQKTYQVILHKIKIALIKFADSAKTLVWNNWLGMQTNDVYIKGSAVRKKANVRFLAVVAVVIVGLLYFSFKGISNSVANNKLRAEYTDKLDAAIVLVQKVGDLAAVKAQANNSDPDKMELFANLTEAEELLNEIKTFDEFSDTANEKLEEIQGYRDTLNRIIPVTSLTLLEDYGASFPGAEVVDMVVGESNIYAIDKKYGKVYQTSITGESKEIVGGLDQPRAIAIDDAGNLLVLDDDDTKSLSKIVPSTGEITRFAGTSQANAGSIDKITFSDIGEGRLYGIDRANSKIVYMNRAGGNYGYPTERFAFDELSTAEDLEIIDGKIYVLVDYNQGIYRFYNDQDDVPAVIGLQAGENLFNATAMYVDGLNIYIGDPVGKRVIVFTKEETQMKFVKQYVYRGDKENGFENISEIFVNQTSGRLYVLDGDIIYKISI